MGVIGLIITLYYTRKATIAAAKATHIAEIATKDAVETMSIARASAAASMRTAEAAAEQVRLSRDALVLTERAYVSQTALEWTEVFHPVNAKTLAYNFGIRWENTGNTPAIGANSNTNMSIRPTIDVSEFDFPDFVKVAHIPKGIGPNGHVSSAKFSITIEQIEEMARGFQRFFLWGWYEYDDIFEGTPRHRTEVAIEISIDAVIYPRAIRFVESSFGVFNGADQTCMKPLQTAKGGRGAA